jgi:hypothetical protein
MQRNHPLDRRRCPQYHPEQLPQAPEVPQMEVQQYCDFFEHPRPLLFISEAGSTGERPRLRDRVREELRRRNYSRKTEKSYIAWMYRFWVFHGRRSLPGLGEAEIASFLTHLR